MLSVRTRMIATGTTHISKQPLALLLGFGHYFLVSLSIVFDESTGSSSHGLHHYFALALFCIANYHQFKCNLILSKAKKAAAGRYAIPRGDWFEFCTSPLYTTEILIYTALWAATEFQSTNLGYVLLWVLSNQSVSAYTTRKWYLAHFPDFPKERWILLPFW